MNARFSGITVAALVALIAGTVSVSPTAPSARAQEKTGGTQSAPLAQQLIGTWRLAEAANPGDPSGIGTRLKMFTGTHWSVIQPDPQTGLIIFQHGGRYELEGETVKTTRDFAGESTQNLIGSTASFKITIEDDTMKQADADGGFNETWKRVE